MVLRSRASFRESVTDIYGDQMKQVDFVGSIGEGSIFLGGGVDGSISVLFGVW